MREQLGDRNFSHQTAAGMCGLTKEGCIVHRDSGISESVVFNPDCFGHGLCEQAERAG